MSQPGCTSSDIDVGRGTTLVVLYSDVNVDNRFVAESVDATVPMDALCVLTLNVTLYDVLLSVYIGLIPSIAYVQFDGIAVIGHESSD